MSGYARFGWTLSLLVACSTSATRGLEDVGRDAGVEAPDRGVPDTGPKPDAAAGPRDVGLDVGLDVGPQAPDASPEPPDLLDQLRAIPGLTADEYPGPTFGTRAFLLSLEQPEDQLNPSRVRFRQRMVLIHRGAARPTVLHTTGYDLFGDPLEWTAIWTEPAEILEANQLTVEHRFFGESIAPSPDWTKLDIEQSANDSHRIVELLSAIYRGPWVATGASKGGMTALFHQRFFPGDLAATVPYVAPISFLTAAGEADPRYIPWLAQIGPTDGACRRRVLDMKREACERRVELARYLESVDPRTRALRPEVLEVAVTIPVFEFHWLFWQYLGSVEACDNLPIRGGPIEQLSSWFPFDPTTVVQPDPYDPGLWPYYYQALHELGFPAIDDSDLQTVTSSIDYSLLPTLTPEPVPWGAHPPPDLRPMREVDAFLRNEARHVLGVYGAWDPWTGGRANLGRLGSENASYTVPQHTHDATLSFLPAAEQREAALLLRTWTQRRGLLGAASDAEVGLDGLILSSPGQRRLMELVHHRERSLRTGVQRLRGRGAR